MGPNASYCDFNCAWGKAERTKLGILRAAGETACLSIRFTRTRGGNISGWRCSSSTVAATLRRAILNVKREFETFAGLACSAYT
jgi:hypothetical protein